MATLQSIAGWRGLWCIVSRTRWGQRDPDYLGRDGLPVYDRKAKVRIWSEKLKAEFFPARKPTQTQRLQIAAAVVLILELSAAHESFLSGQPLPKDYLPKLNALRAILVGFRPKAPKGKTIPKATPRLAAILGGEV
jgi:hypothetical protein